jgi:hypothetical protein
MSFYTVHQPPLPATGAAADPARFVFVRDGFYVWAFLLTPFWLLWHRLWLMLVSYIVILAVVDGGLRFASASATVIALVGVLISLLIGLEAGSLRRVVLQRRRWRNVGLVSGYDLEDAERRFFDTWVRGAPSRSDSPSAASLSVPPTAVPARTSGRTSDTSDVIGYFPEPGAQR